MGCERHTVPTGRSPGRMKLAADNSAPGRLPRTSEFLCCRSVKGLPRAKKILVIGGFAPVFQRDHVIDLMLCKRKSLGNAAIFAAAAGARSNERPQIRIDVRHYPQRMRVSLAQPPLQPGPGVPDIHIFPTPPRPRASWRRRGFSLPIGLLVPTDVGRAAGS